jgi:hypothetical protein
MKWGSCVRGAIGSIIEGVHEIFNLEAQVVTMPVFFQPEWAFDIEATLLIWVTHEGGPVCQLNESRDPIPQFVQLFIP